MSFKDGDWIWKNVAWAYQDQTGDEHDDLSYEAEEYADEFCLYWREFTEGLKSWPKRQIYDLVNRCPVVVDEKGKFIPLDKVNNLEEHGASHRLANLVRHKWQMDQEVAAGGDPNEAFCKIAGISLTKLAFFSL